MTDAQSPFSGTLGQRHDYKLAIRASSALRILLSCQILSILIDIPMEVNGDWLSQCIIMTKLAEKGG